MFKVKVFGDSHTLYFKYKSMRPGYLSKNIKGFDLDVNVYQSASMRGFGNRQSTLAVSEDILTKVNDGDVAVLCFGQVDLELGWFYSLVVKKEKITLKQFINRCIESFSVLCDDLTSKGVRVVIKGINYPVLLDAHKAKLYVGRIITEGCDDEEHLKNSKLLLNDIYPELFERIEYVDNFNWALQQFSNVKSYSYFDINEEIANKIGIVYERYIPASFDHHLVDSIEVRLIHQKALQKSLLMLESEK